MCTQSLSYTHVVLSPYLDVCVFTQLQYTEPELHSCGPVSISIFVQFFLQLMYILCHYHLFLQTIPIIYSYFFIENYFFVSFKQIPFCNFFLCPLQFLASPFLLNIRSFLSVFSRLFINLYIVIKSDHCSSNFFHHIFIQEMKSHLYIPQHPERLKVSPNIIFMFL